MGGLIQRVIAIARDRFGGWRGRRDLEKRFLRQSRDPKELRKAMKQAKKAHRHYLKRIGWM